MKTKPTEKKFAVKTEMSVTYEMVGNLLTNAFEGGSGYWAPEARVVADSVKKLTFGTDQNGDNYHRRIVRYPLSGGKALVMEDCGEGEKPVWRTLDMAAIQRGLDLMARDYPKHFSNIIAENDDAETADVFLQLALLGEIKYG